jgi:hypothetical protein
MHKIRIILPLIRSSKCPIGAPSRLPPIAITAAVTQVTWPFSYCFYWLTSNR